MKVFPFSLASKRKKAKTPPILDIGTESLKVRDGENYLQYFDDFKETDGYSKAVKDVFKILGRKPEKVMVTLPANIFKARIVLQVFQRERPESIIDAREEEKIQQIVFERTKDEVSRIFSRESGILPSDLRIVDLRILPAGIKIDGYEVQKLEGYEGKNLEFKILASFLPEFNLKEIERVIPSAQLVHEAEGLILWLKSYPDGIFLDVGGRTTQVFLAREGRLAGVGEFALGGKIFAEAISEKLGLRSKDARILKEKYAKRELSEEAVSRVREIFYFPKRIWFENLKSKLKEMRESGLLPSDFFLFGGASQLPEIKRVLKEGDWSGISFRQKPRVKAFKNPQFAPCLLISRTFTTYEQKDY